MTYDADHRVNSVTRITNTTTMTGPTTAYAYYDGSDTTHGHTCSVTSQTKKTIVTDPDGHTTTYCSNLLDEVFEVWDADGHETTQSYTTAGNVSQATTGTGAQLSLAYSTLNQIDRLTTATEPTGATQTLAYGNSSHPYEPSQLTDSMAHATSYTYDSHGNLASIADALGNTTTLTDNANGTLATETDPGSHTTSYGYDTSGNLTSVTPPSPLGAIGHTVDTLSRHKTITDGAGKTETISYDPRDRVTQRTYAGGVTVSYAYDPDGNLVSTTDPSGTTIYHYDLLNRVTEEDYPDSTSTTYAYDAAGNLASVTDVGGTTTYGYDATNQVTSITEPGSLTTTISYNADGAETSRTYPNGATVSNSYQTDGSGHVTDRLASTTARNASNAVIKQITYTYGQPSGTDSDLIRTATDEAGNVTTYTYDGANRLTEAKTVAPGGGTAADYQYSYDAVGNLTGEIVNGSSSTFGHNAASELTSVGATTYSYDGAGNLTGDSSGNSFSYNALEQTSSIQPTGGSAVAMSYRSAGQSERTGAGATTFHNNALGLASSTNASGTAYYTRDPAGRLIGERTPSGRFYYVFDANESVIGLTDSAGASAASYAYDPYGGATSTSGSAPNPWRFASGYLDSNTSLYHFGERYYNPGVGSWTQMDPLGDGYRYAGDDPVNNNDPTGLVDFGPGFLCAVTAYAPYSTGDYGISATAANVCKTIPGYHVSYSAVQACLQRLSNAGSWGTHDCASQHRYSPGYVYTLVTSRCTTIGRWRNYGIGVSFVNGIPQRGDHISPSKILRCY
jgi:RHS repeat-associated protein